MTRLLLCNPWIFDFAACDFWLKPLGLLALGSAFNHAGFETSLLDLADCSLVPVPEIQVRLKRRPDGRGRFFAEEIQKPEALQAVPRRYKRYGLPPQNAEQILRSLPPPDAILLGTTMTYWSRAYSESAKFLRGIFPETPLIVGGLYVRLCPEHARKNLDADFFCGGDYEQNLPSILQELFGFSGKLPGPEETRLALELYPRLDYGVLLTGRGCPFRCRYCASWKLHPSLKRKPVEMVVDEIIWQAEHLGLKNIAFYDDALILGPEKHIMPVLEGVIRAGIDVRFHTPNGIHLKPMSRELAVLMKRAGFATIRFGLETADQGRQKNLGFKAEIDDLEQALAFLEKAGYQRGGIGVYLLAGLPGQRASEIAKDILAVKKLGARPYLSEYSPIPGSDLWEESLQSARYPFADEPLLQNCSLLPCAHESLTAGAWTRLKNLCHS